MRQNVCVAVVLGMIAVSSYAAHDDKGLDTRIDSWVEGTVLSLDADSQKFSVRGVKMPYASAHCSMMQAIHADKANDDAIRKSWADKLAKADAEQPATESDFNFALPAKTTLKVMDDSAVAGMDFLFHDRVQRPAGAAVTTGKGAATEVKVTADGAARTNDQKEAQAMLTLRDLKVGDTVMVGYDSGVLTNEAFVTVKRTAKPSSAPAQR